MRDGKVRDINEPVKAVPLEALKNPEEASKDPEEVTPLMSPVNPDQDNSKQENPE